MPDGISVGVPVAPMTMIRSPGRHSAQSRDDVPISSAISEISPSSLSTQAPVSASPSVTSTVSSIRGALLSKL